VKLPLLRSLTAQELGRHRKTLLPVPERLCLAAVVLGMVIAERELEKPAPPPSVASSPGN